MEEITIRVDGEEYLVKVEETDEGKVLVHCGNDVYELESYNPSAETLFGKRRKNGAQEKNGNVIVAPLPGIIFDVKVKEHDVVKEGQSLVKLIAMKMENNIAAPKDCTITKVKVRKNQTVNKGDVLIEIE